MRPVKNLRGDFNKMAMRMLDVVHGPQSLVTGTGAFQKCVLAVIRPERNAGKKRYWRFLD